MMEKLSDEEKFLLLGRVADSLNGEESATFEQLFRDKPDIRLAYEELLNNLPAEDARNAFARRKTHNGWRDLAGEFRKKQAAAGKVHRIPFYKNRWAAAAIIIGIVATAAWLWMPSRKSDPLPAVAGRTQPGIELKLADGQTIDLSKEQGSIQTGTVQLTNSYKTLRYAAGNNSASTGVNTLTVPIGMDYKILLGDGTSVWLNAATRLSFPLAFTGATREIRIEGEAYLQVAKDAAHPFIVHLPGSSVQVLGTSFNVNTYDTGIVKVALVEGLVKMTAATGESRLLPGKQAVYKSGGAIEQESFDARDVLSWREGLYYFKDASLSEISKVTPRWYGVQVIIDNPAIMDRRFSGVINRNRPISVFLDDLKFIAKIDSWFDKDRVLHFR